MVAAADEAQDVGMEQHDSPEPGSSVTTWLGSLRRSSTDRMLTGVAGGIAQRTGVPALVVRAAFVLAAFAGFGIPLYLIAWVLIPTDGGRRITDGGGIKDWLAVGVVVIAGLMLTGQVAGFSTADLIWRSLPWALMLVGIALITRRRETGPATPPDVAAPVPPVAPGQSGADQATPNPATPARSRIRPPAFPVVGLLTWCAVLVVCSVLGVLSLAEIIHIGPGVVGAFALIGFGVGLVYSAFQGRARGLILPALSLAVVFAGLGAIDMRVDNVDGPFHLAVADAAELPSDLRTSFSSSSLDLSRLELDSDRYLRIDQTAGTLTVVLPAAVNVRLDTHLGVGDGSITRPSRDSAISMNEEVARKWLEDGVPGAGEAIDPSLFAAGSERGAERIASWWGSSSTFISGVNTQDERLIDRGGAHTLELEIHMGAGSLRLIDPHWSRDAVPELKTPTQLCTVGGGPRGVVEPCGDVPENKRVALCINDNSYLVDCREDREATPDYPRIAACRGILGDEVDCREVNIDPIGAQLITAEQSADSDEPDEPDDQVIPDDTIKMPDASASVAPSSPTSAAAPTTTDPETSGGRP